MLSRVNCVNLYRIIKKSKLKWRFTDMRIAVVGGGAAGFEALNTFISGKFEAELTLISDEPVLPYRRPALTRMLAEPVPDAQFYLKPDSYYRDNGIALELNNPAVALDAADRRLTLKDGKEITADKIILACGASSRTLPLKGAELEGIFPGRHLSDFTAASDYVRLNGVKRAAVIGGGLLGLEFAAGLVAKGVDVAVLELCPFIMPRQLDEEGGRIFMAAMKKVKNLSAHYGVHVTGFTGKGGKVAAVELGEGDAVPAELVIWAMGAAPNIALAEAGGLAVNRGIITGRDMQSSVAGIYAAGDCAEVDGVVSGLWNPAREQGKVAALNIMGEHTEYTVKPAAARFTGFGTRLYSIGEAGGCVEGVEREVSSDPAKGVYQALTRRDGRLTGILLLGDVSAALKLEKELLG